MMRQTWIWMITMIVLLLCGCNARAGKYVFSVEGDKCLLNGREMKIIGLRCSNAAISDAETQELIDNLDTFKSYGVNTVSVFFMGSRFGDVQGYKKDATLDPAYARRIGRIIEAADDRGMVVLVGCLYWSTSKAKAELGHWTQEHANRAIANTIRWLKKHDYRNVFVDPDNEGMAVRATKWDSGRMIEAGRAVDDSFVIGYNNRAKPPAAADILLHHSPKDPRRPWIQSEGTPNNAPGGYWGSYSKQGRRYNNGPDLYNYINVGVYNDAMKQNQYKQTRNDINEHNGHILASTWLQCVPPKGPNHTPGGDGSKNNPGIKWWLEYVRDNFTAPWTPPKPLE